MAKKDPIKKLLQDITEATSDSKGAIIGAVIGYLASDTLEKHPEIRNAVLGAIAGQTDFKALLPTNKENK